MALIVDQYDALYGIGRYGSARYGIVTPIYVVEGQRLTSALGTIEVQVSEKSESARATFSLGTPTYTATANKALVGIHADLTLGTSVIAAAANIAAEPVTITSGTSDSTFEAKANQEAAPVSATITLGTVSAKSINRVPVDGFTLSIESGIVEITLRTYVTGVRTSSSLGLVKVNLKKVVSSVRSTIALGTSTTKAPANKIPASNRSSITLGDIKKQLNTKPTGIRVTVTNQTAFPSADANKVLAHTRISTTVKSGTATGVAFNFSTFANNYSPRRTLYIPQAA